MTFETVTELPESKVSQIQLQRIINRYGFARDYCKDKDVLEIACGPGLGLGLLKKVARSLVATDIEWHFLKQADTWYNGTIKLAVTDAEALPFHNSSFDVILLFEAIYYFENPLKFAQEISRVLRPGGNLIISNPNKHIPGFVPSRWGHNYLDEFDIRELFGENQFSILAFGDDRFLTKLGEIPFLDKIRVLASKLEIYPTSMKTKAIFRRLVFGKLVEMPHELSTSGVQPQPLVDLQMNLINRTHRITFFVVTLSVNRTCQSAQDSNGLDGASNTSIRMMVDHDIDHVAHLYKILIDDDIMSKLDDQLLARFLRTLLPVSDSFVLANNNQPVGFLFAIPEHIVKIRQVVFFLRNYRWFVNYSLFSKPLLVKLLKKLPYLLCQTDQTPKNSKTSLRVLAIGIIEEYQMRGFGKDLLKKVQNKYPAHEFIVSAFIENVNAIQFYEKIGFRLTNSDNQKHHLSMSSNVNHS